MVNKSFVTIFSIVILVSFFLTGCATTTQKGSAVGHGSDPDDDHGTKIWPNGDKYVGEWKDGERNGQGTYTYDDGEKYVGEWKDDERNGQGTYTWPEGTKYVGEFKDDEIHGQGTFTSPDGTKLVGVWRDGNMNGQGTYTWPDGRKYVGGFKDGKIHGQGTIIWPDSSKYVGIFTGSKEHKMGAITLSDGIKYSGNLQFGVIVSNVTKGSNAGLLNGDIIVEYNGIPIVNGVELLDSLMVTTENQNQVKVEVLRNRVEHDFVLKGGPLTGEMEFDNYPRFEIVRPEL